MTSKRKQVIKKPASAKKAGVDHQYHDWAHVSAADAGLLLPNAATNGGMVRQHNPMASGTQQQGFAVKLHHMLTDIEAFGESTVVAWQPHGRCFVVRDRKAFVERVLPSYFLQSNFASFQRQLNLYGFRRLASAQDRGGYYHELFLRGKPELACFIQRIKRKGTGPRKPDAPENEPDFWSMPYLPAAPVPARQVPAAVPIFQPSPGCIPRVAPPVSVSVPAPVPVQPQKPEVASIPSLKNLLPETMASSVAPPPSNATPPHAPFATPLQLPPPPAANVTSHAHAPSSTTQNDILMHPLLQPTPIGPSTRVVVATPPGAMLLPQQPLVAPAPSQQQPPTASNVPLAFSVAAAATMPLGSVQPSLSAEYIDQLSGVDALGLLTTATATANSPPVDPAQPPQQAQSVDTVRRSNGNAAATGSIDLQLQQQARDANNSGSLSPSSWDNAFGEEEDFWSGLN